MDRLKPMGKIVPKSAAMVKTSRVGIGFEKLDRDVFDPEKAYDKVAATGVKWIRLQSGWARTEKEPGIYDFAWLDSVVDNLTARGLVPWLCLCYGNGLYDEAAAKVFGAVGCPPIHTEAQRTAWDRYVRATVERYRGRIGLYEIWNEPDGQWCWKHGVNAAEYGRFAVDTARAIRETDPNAQIAGGSICLRTLDFLNGALQAGMGDWIDYVTFHEYTHAEELVFERVQAIRALLDRYNPKIRIIQGESGSQSRRGGAGALREGAWSEERQAKQLARHTMADLLTEAVFASYFSCMDMIEALNGTVGDLSSYLDYGYFGVLGAQFDENGYATGTYQEKPSYYVLQNIASLFAEEHTVKPLPLILQPQYSRSIYTSEPQARTILSGGITKASGEAWIYWNPTNIMTTSYSGTISGQIYSPYTTATLADIMTGTIYEVPADILHRTKEGIWHFQNLPILDTPLVLMFGEFSFS